MVKHAKKGHHEAPIAHTARQLRQPHARGHLQARQKNVVTQHQFLAAQNAMQDRMKHIQRMSYTGNPYIRWTKVLRPVPTFDQLVNLPIPQLTPPERAIEVSRPDPNVF